MSDSEEYWNATGTLGVLDPTTANGIPIGSPSYNPDPKSGWTGSPRPMAAMIAAEFLATGSRSTRWFQALFAGKIGQLGALGSGRADTSAGTATAPIAAISDREARATSEPAHGSGDDGEPAGDHAERGLVDVAEVVAVDLERQRPLVARFDEEPIDA